MGASFVAHVLFLLCFFATTFSFFLKAESNVSCNEKDKQALLNFKQGLSDPFGVLSSWSDQEDCSTWDEVVYDNKTGQVTKLHLNYWGFGGEISGSLLQLEHLNYLDLSGNDFNRTPIPTFLGSMASLTHLDLRWSNFSGHIPHQLGHLSNLRYLDLAGALPHCWKYWQSLTHLDLGSNDISGRIPYSIGSLVALQSLHLQNNRISGDIPSSLKKCSNLSLIDIGENPLSVAIPPWIGEMTSLTILRLSSNGFKGHIPLQICQLSSLIVLDLANNRLWGHIPNCLKNISAMTIPTPRLEAQSPYFILYRGTYVENLKFVPKGVELEYEENLGFVKIIDLSRLGLCDYCAKRELVARKAKKLPPLVSESRHYLAKREWYRFMLFKMNRWQRYCTRSYFLVLS
nr:leucine-rich repeat receptor-like protein kinase pxc2 [Quercus suber]